MLNRKITSSKVSEYLQKNPDFFLKNPKILSVLSFPSPGDFKNINNIVSFKDWLISNLKKRQDNLIDNARHNFFTQKKVLDCSLEIIEYKDPRQFENFVTKKCPKIFNLDEINIVVFGKVSTIYKEIIISDSDEISKIYSPNGFLIMDAADKNLNFFNNIKNKIYSNAIFSLNKNLFNTQSLLVFGSKDNHFIANKAYDLILFLSKIIEYKLIELSKND